MPEDVIETRGGRVWLEDGIVMVVNPQGCELGEAEAHELLGAMERLCGDHKSPLFVDGSGIRKMHRSARAAFAGDRAQRCIAAQAILASSPVARAVGNFLIGLNRPPFPMRLFETREEALEWLSGYRV